MTGTKYRTVLHISNIINKETKNTTTSIRMLPPKMHKFDSWRSSSLTQKTVKQENFGEENAQKN